MTLFLSHTEWRAHSLSPPWRAHLVRLSLSLTDAVEEFSLTHSISLSHTYSDSPTDSRGRSHPLTFHLHKQSGEHTQKANSLNSRTSQSHTKWVEGTLTHSLTGLPLSHTHSPPTSTRSLSLTSHSHTAWMRAHSLTDLPLSHTEWRAHSLSH